MIVPDAYIGDGVYASFDGYHVTMDLRGQDDSTMIALEPRVIDGLLGFIEHCYPGVIRAKLPEQPQASEPTESTD